MSAVERAPAAAYGKLILLGEHAVVYGTPALVSGIDLQVRAQLRVGGRGQRLSLLGRDCVPDASGKDDLARAFAALLAEGGAPDALSLVVDGELPPGMGLGFSAAAAVAIARAIESHSGEVDEERVRARATAWEGVFHGNPSGVDVAAAMHGGCVRFTRKEGIRRVAVRQPLSLCVGLTGTSASTREMVEGVARIKESDPEHHARSIEAIAALVDNGIGAVEAGDVAALGEMMNLNQMLLSGLMVSTDVLEQLCALAREAGAIGAKLTGAGGGGAMVALAGTGDDAALISASVVEAWRAAGFSGFATVVDHGHREVTS